MQVVVGEWAAEAVRQALGRVLDDGEGLAVLPEGPPAWQQTIREALVLERPAPRCVVLPTSGSSASPRGVLLGAEAVSLAARSVNERLGGPGGWLLALPLTHVAGVMVLARAVVADSAVAVAAAPFDAEAFDEAAGRLSGRRYTALVPTQLHRLLEAGSAALPRFDAVLVGGAAVGPLLARRAEQAGVRVIESYGMTETAGGCVHDGVPLPGVDVDVREGRLAIAGPVLARAYRDGNADSPLAPDGWFVTGDLGEVVDGRVRVHGRADDVVISGGVAVPLAAVDALLAEHPAVADAAAVGVADPEWGARLVAVAVARAGADLTLADLRRFVAQRAEPAHVPRQLVLVDVLPRPGTGKVDRAALARLVEER